MTDTPKSKKKAAPKKKAPAKKKAAAKIGRPTDFKGEYLIQVKRLCLLGAKDKEIAEFFNIAERTLNNWKKDIPEFMQSIRDGKEEADANVTESLYKRALGYTVTETKQEDGTNGKKSTTATKHIPGDTSSAIFWLKNRQPERWRDKIHSESINHNLDYANKTDDEIDQMLSRLES